MIVEPLDLPGAFRIRLTPQSDARGYFARTFSEETFRQHGLETGFVQRSISFNHKAGTLRGLHFQTPPHAETKLVRCTRGAVYDAIVDLRAGSPTFGRWHAEELSADNHVMLYIPKGFAHGFQTLADASELSYEITPAYVPDAARGIRFNDPKLAIPWPVGATIMSDRDRALGALDSIVPL